MERTAIVTGGTGGLGGAVVAAFLDAGWRVVAPWRGDGRGRLPEHERLAAVEADLLDPDAAARLAAEAGTGLRAVVNVAGGFAAPGRVHEVARTAFDDQLRLNLDTAYAVTAAGLPALLAAGEGSVVCVSSRAARHPFAGAAGYVVAKAAILAFVDALDAEYGDDGIRASALIPSVIDTPANRAAMPDADRAGWQSPADLAATILALCGDPAGDRRADVHVPAEVAR
ncbi:SDR family NAD(P)-dependent oxidoreductase [Patulibacter defluvii]|uniref:SDR family NAD(P)-dependent oxidoreductase n=1 Tax=Patulibacter defluvii TaxID=3095358 RepID=UPI002A74E1E7|nr:SDR family NAD(P)-dependent oxidoreductase [Patulibacter sp. DM4]